MSLSYIDWELNGVTVLNLSGDLTLGEGTRKFREIIREMIAGGKTKLLLNLAEVNHIDSSGLGEMVGSYTSVRNRGGELKLMKLARRARDLIYATKLYTIFEVFDEEQPAIASFAADTKP